MSQLRPKVNIDVKSDIALLAQTGVATTAFIGTSQWGPIDTVTTVNNLAEAITQFGDDISGETLTLIKGLDLYYRNVGGTAKIVRIADSDKTKSTLTLDAGSTSVVRVDGKYYGTYGDNIMVTVTANGLAKDVNITDGISTETYDNAGNGYLTNNALVTAINAGSNLVSSTSLDNTYLVDALSQTNLASGDDGEDGLVTSDYTDILDAELLLENFDILCVPGMTADAFQTAVMAKVNSRVIAEDKYSVYISGIAVDETIATASERTTTGQRFTLVAPNCDYTNRISDVSTVIDGSYLACAYAGLVATNWPAISPTHKILNVEGLSILESASTIYYNNGQQNQLLNSMITPITKIGTSIMPTRAVTRHTSTTEVYYEQNIVDIIHYVKYDILNLLTGFIGKPNLSRIRAVIAKNIDGYLEQYKLDEIINDFTATQVEEGTSTDTINVTMVIKPTFAVNFINVTLTISSL